MKASTTGLIQRQCYFDTHYFQLDGPEKAKIRVLKVNYFHLSRKKDNSNWNCGLIFMPLLFIINEIKNLCQFSEEKNSKKWALNHVVWYKNQFSHWNTVVFRFKFLAKIEKLL